MTTKNSFQRAISQLKVDVSNDMSTWAQDVHGQDTGFSIGVQYGLSQAIARILYLEHQIAIAAVAATELATQVSLPDAPAVTEGADSDAWTR